MTRNQKLTPKEIAFRRLWQIIQKNKHLGFNIDNTLRGIPRDFIRDLYRKTYNKSASEEELQLGIAAILESGKGKASNINVDDVEYECIVIAISIS
ncbi:hypothetical protein [Microvirga puerhi]|uniref:Uncharacterized protein n=1 Tax=Microvirga puerhi TaxID=2876078 RepID=A0ABS7VM94_9HYPH|nr:hypothetical protein [Microvirga puerhi]MBZ6076200.1 hypothetical protein [Microvirga puerhi]